MKKLVLLLLVVPLGACSTARGGGVPWPTTGDVVVVGDEDRDDRNRDRRRAPRSLGGVPPGHYPPPGECRVWYPGRPPGQQPPPTKCGGLVGRVPLGAFVLYDDKGWDTEYDWRADERRRPGSVPEAILRIMSALRGG